MKKWSALSTRTQRKYTARGVSPQKYNAWLRPEVRRNARERGVERWQFLGMQQPLQPTRAYLETNAYTQFVGMFGQSKQFNATTLQKSVSKLSTRTLRAWEQRGWDYDYYELVDDIGADEDDVWYH